MNDLIMSPLKTWWAKTIIGIAYFSGLILVAIYLPQPIGWWFLAVLLYAAVGIALFIVAGIAGAERDIRKSGMYEFWEQEAKLKRELSPQWLYEISKDWR